MQASRILLPKPLGVKGDVSGGRRGCRWEVGYEFEIRPLNDLRAGPHTKKGPVYAPWFRRNQGGPGTGQSPHLLRLPAHVGDHLFLQAGVIGHRNFRANEPALPSHISKARCKHGEGCFDHR